MNAIVKAVFVALVALAVDAGCSSSPASRCTPGASVACAGPGGCAGAQVCSADGASFGSCVCRSAGGSSGSSTGGSSGGGCGLGGPPCWPHWDCLQGDPDTSTTLDYFTAAQNPDGSCTITGRQPTPASATTTFKCDGQTSDGSSWTYDYVPGVSSLGKQMQFILQGQQLSCGAIE